ncbi:MAG: TolC family protein [Spirochaetales bacterium]|nr:TolC family protein [Spirochaetales bacterium]
MRFLSKMSIYIFIFLAGTGLVYAQTILDDYVAQGLANNLALKQKQFNLLSGIASVNEAWGNFFPTVTVEARATWNGGGREIIIPVGDLLSPVYQTINGLHGTALQPPDVEYAMPLYVEDEQEIKIRVVQPIFIPSIYFNLQIQSQLAGVRELEVDIYTRFLKTEIKRAYFNYLKAMKVVVVFEKMHEVLNENLRVSEKLFQAGMITQDAVFRAKAEIASIIQQQLEAKKQTEQAASYFNFLLNRPHDTAIEVLEFPEFESAPSVSYQEAEACALSLRAEMILVQKRIITEENIGAVAISNYIPKVTAAFEYGLLANQFDINFDNNFWSFSIVAQWEIFDGLRNFSQNDRSLQQQNLIRTELAELREKIKLEVRQAYNDVMVAEQTIYSSRQELESMAKYFEIITRKYNEGIVTQMEYMDAQSRLTRAEINKLVAEYDYLIKYARFEAVTHIDEKHKVLFNE